MLSLVAILCICLCIVCIPLIVFVVVRTVQKTQVTNMKQIHSHFKNHVSTLEFDADTIPIHTYYINLDRSPERKLHFESQAKVLGLDFSRIEGIDGKVLESHSTKQHGTYGDVSYTNDFDNLTFSELGCTLSHLKAIRQAFNNGDNYALICEDDVSFELCKVWPKHLMKHLIRHMPKDMGIMQLCWDTRERAYCNYAQHFTNVNLSPTDWCWSAVAYIISRKGMIDVLKYSNYISGHVIHLCKTLQIKDGFADKYIYQTTRTSHSGIPLLLPYNFDAKMNSTQHDRGGDKDELDLYSMKLYTDILKCFIDKKGDLNPVEFRIQ